MAGSDEVKLLGGWPSPFVMRPRIAFNLKSIPYDYLDENFRAKSDLLLKSNPVHKKVPFSSTTAARVASGAGRGGDRNYRFRPRRLQDKIVKARRAEAKDEALEKTKVALKRIEELFKDFSKGEKFFGGVGIGYLDIVVGSYLGWVRMAETIITKVKLLNKEKMPELVGWVERFCAHEAVKDVMPEIHMLIDFAKELLSKPTSKPNCEIEKGPN
ncbi:hypothetical protein Scep_017589 [Stephania cephalantha]|uniref:glutathione transferase n=1 Tax=Stephania cephalantha TaxID=152367 RepID=A0AAP0IPT7_9MAGN